METFNRCWQWFAGTVIGCGAAVFAAFVIAFQCHAEAQGAAGSDRAREALEQQLFEQRIWIVWVIAALIPTAGILSAALHTLFRKRATI